MPKYGKEHIADILVTTQRSGELTYLSTQQIDTINTRKLFSWLLKAYTIGHDQLQKNPAAVLKSSG